MSDLDPVQRRRPPPHVTRIAQRSAFHPQGSPSRRVTSWRVAGLLRTRQFDADRYRPGETRPVVAGENRLATSNQPVDEPSAAPRKGHQDRERACRVKPILESVHENSFPFDGLAGWDTSEVAAVRRAAAPISMVGLFVPINDEKTTRSGLSGIAGARPVEHG